jgi:hypothetical protein
MQVFSLCGGRGLQYCKVFKNKRRFIKNVNFPRKIKITAAQSGLNAGRAAVEQPD